jgi:hypothetical protein
MKRTTVALPDELAALLDEERQRRAVPAATIIREALTAYLPRRDGASEQLPFVGIGRSGARDTAREAEAILAREYSKSGPRRSHELQVDACP